MWIKSIRTSVFFFFLGAVQICSSPYQYIMLHQYGGQGVSYRCMSQQNKFQSAFSPGFVCLFSWRLLLGGTFFFFFLSVASDINEGFTQVPGVGLVLAQQSAGVVPLKGVLDQFF